jgi:predicted Na+-dependent transporter
MQNAGLGAVLALKHFSYRSAVPSALFAVWCIITASILAEFWGRKSEQG